MISLRFVTNTLLCAFLFLQAEPVLAKVNYDKFIEQTPTVLFSCQAQAFVMPWGQPDPRKQIFIATELLEKGFRTDRILAHDRVIEGSFWIFGTISQVLFKFQVEKQSKEKLKLEVAERAYVLFQTGRTYQVPKDSIRIMGCEIRELF